MAHCQKDALVHAKVGITNGVRVSGNGLTSLCRIVRGCIKRLLRVFLPKLVIGLTV